MFAGGLIINNKVSTAPRSGTEGKALQGGDAEGMDDAVPRGSEARCGDVGVWPWEEAAWDALPPTTPGSSTPKCCPASPHPLPSPSLMKYSGQPAWLCTPPTHPQAPDTKQPRPAVGFSAWQGQGQVEANHLAPPPRRPSPQEQLVRASGTRGGVPSSEGCLGWSILEGRAGLNLRS